VVQVETVLNQNRARSLLKKVEDCLCTNDVEETKRNDKEWNGCKDILTFMSTHQVTSGSSR
jgi:hypothetical protein